ncbi:acetyl-CoA carboxylase biotin carboxyl carrier protein subunit [Thalassotalea sp. Y01]|uniref:biotin/lipoyl-containing protein n=1 Tax=Thalassotalea sp. Y01 TaxID=2729613 RepID=UPI00145F64A6|nr:acetyl-CoA carboxylase biotin carboxyl carrier protein subunit [Thalassotalea sp. Y01]NMP15550.1 hypothetical protein [Thalassotalea sp. Y01]
MSSNISNIFVPLLSDNDANAYISQICVSVGQQVSANQVLFEIRIGKVNHEIRASHDGIIAEVLCASGDRVRQEQLVMVLDAAYSRVATQAYQQLAQPTQQHVSVQSELNQDLKQYAHQGDVIESDISCFLVKMQEMVINVSKMLCAVILAGMTLTVMFN